MSVRHVTHVRTTYTMSVQQIICRTDKSYDADFLKNVAYFSIKHLQLHNSFNK